MIKLGLILGALVLSVMALREAIRAADGRRLGDDDAARAGRALGAIALGIAAYSVWTVS